MHMTDSSTTSSSFRQIWDLKVSLLLPKAQKNRDKSLTHKKHRILFSRNCPKEVTNSQRKQHLKGTLRMIQRCRISRLCSSAYINTLLSLNLYHINVINPTKSSKKCTTFKSHSIASKYAPSNDKAGHQGQHLSVLSPTDPTSLPGARITVFSPGARIAPYTDPLIPRRQYSVSANSLVSASSSTAKTPTSARKVGLMKPPVSRISYGTCAHTLPMLPRTQHGL
jgi:hypothetical protein